MDFNFELYDGKSYSDLMKDIVKNHKNKQSQIKILIQQLTEMVSEPGDAVVIVPLIKGYLDSDIKNDEALVKLAQIAQRASAPAAGSDSFSEKDLEMLFSDLHKNTAPLDEKETKGVKELPASV
jgi:hypothetical protein